MDPVHVSQQVVSGTNAFGTGQAEAIWIATFTFFIVWLLGLLLTPLISMLHGSRKMPMPSSGATGATEAGTTPASGSGQPTQSYWSSRLANFTRAARDSFLILLGMTLVNVSGHGVTGVS